MKKQATFSFGLAVFMFLFFSSCSSSKSDKKEVVASSDHEKLIEVLTLFVEAVQGERFDKAFFYLTPAEKAKMADATGLPPLRVQRQLKALRLSTLAQKNGVSLELGKLQGIYEWLPQVEARPKHHTADLDAPLIQ